MKLKVIPAFAIPEPVDNSVNCYHCKKFDDSDFGFFKCEAKLHLGPPEIVPFKDIINESCRDSSIGNWKWVKL